METLANRNNNPGNIKDTSTGKFKVYATPEEGYAALLNDLQTKKTGKSSTGLKSDQTLADFAKVYAPSSDSNNPAQYTANIANHMGVRPDTKISDLDTGKWAEAIANAEGYKGGASNNRTANTVRTFDDIPDTVQTPEQPQQSGSLGTNKGDSAFGKATDNSITRGLIKVVPGAKTLGESIGTLGGLAYEKAKGLVGGKDNSKYYDTSAPSVKDTTKAAIKTVGAAYLVKGAGGLLTKAFTKTTPLAVKEGLKRVGLSEAKFNSMKSADKVEALTESLKRATPVNAKVIQQSIDKLLPAAIKEAGGKVAFSSLYPNAARALRIGKNISGGLLKTAATLGGLGAAAGGVRGVYNKFTK